MPLNKNTHKIKSFEIKFMDKYNCEEEFHKRTYKVYPMFLGVGNPSKTALLTISDDINTAILGNDRRTKLLTIKTHKTTFYYWFKKTKV